MATLVLISSDNVEFKVERKVACQSQLIKHMLGDESGEQAPAIPITKVNETVLRKVLEWCEHHKDDPEPESSNTRFRLPDIGEWDQRYISVDSEMLFEIIMAAHFLEIKQLLDLGCRTVANMIKGIPPDALRKTFNIQNDFTPEEEDQIRRENEWAEDR